MNETKSRRGRSWGIITVAALVTVGAIAFLAYQYVVPTVIQWQGATLSLKDLPPVRFADGKDYLSPELRKRVEQLKRDVESSPSTTETSRERALLLFEWANAYAMQGRTLHPETASLVAIITQPDFARTSPPRIAFTLLALDNFVWDLSLREAIPDALGSLTTSNMAPLPVNSYQTLEQTYTVGALALKPGAGFMVPNHFYFALTEYQADDPTADNYVSIKSSNPVAKFEVSSTPTSGMFAPRLGGFAPRTFFQLSSGVLAKGDTVTITIGDKSGGSRGLKLIHWSNSAAKFPIWIITDTRVLMPLPEQKFVLEGLRTVGVHGFAPSIARPGEAFALSVRSEDQFRNRATGAFPGRYNVLANGQLVRQVETHGQAVSVIPDMSFERPGVYHIALVSDDGGISGEANPILVTDESRPRLYWGETHGHGGFSEGMGDIDAYYDFAEQDSRLDFIMLSEHDLWMDDAEWETMRETVARRNKEGSFLTYLGYEWTGDVKFGGHHNVMFRNFSTAKRISRQYFPTSADLYRGLSQAYELKDFLVIPHAHMPGDWTKGDRKLERLVEISSEHGTFEWFGRKYLDAGYETGLVAASDNHIGHPGYRPPMLGRGYNESYGGLAAVMAPELTTNGIFDALYNRSTYATNGHRIILDAKLNGASMGTKLPSTPSRRIEGRAIGTGPIDSITIVKNGKDQHIYDYLAEGAHESNILELKFFSGSEPAKMPGMARESQGWSGTMRVEGAKIAQVTAPVAEALNRLAEYARVKKSDPSVIEFRLRTRGFDSRILLTLADITANAKITLAFDDTPLSANGTFDLSALRTSPKRFDQPKTADSALLRFVSTVTERERLFDFVDPEPGKDGDYYYVRVSQTNGGLAWSSPFWVGR